MTARSIVGGASIVAVVAAIGGAIALMGSPGEQRAYRLDDRRVQDLTQVAEAINLFWTSRGRLPASLDELSSQYGSAAYTTDSERGARYDYRTIADSSYELCATFARDSSNTPQGSGSVSFWAHGAGRQCFVRKATERR